MQRQPAQHRLDCISKPTIWTKYRKLQLVSNQTNCSVSGDTLQYRLQESVSHRRTQQVTQLFTHLLTQHLTACHAHINFTFASCTTSMAAIAEIFVCAYSGAQTVRTSPKLTLERHILGCRLVRNDSITLPYIVPIINTLKNTHFQFFGTCM